MNQWHHLLFAILILVVPHNAFAEPAASQTNQAEIPKAASPSNKPLPTWYVFKIKSFKKITHSTDGKSALIEGVTTKDHEFKIKVVWDEKFQGAQRKAIDQWLKRPPAEFEAGIPYIIAGEVLNRDPLTIARHGSRSASRAPRDLRPADVLPGAINMGFADGHVELAPLEQLWKYYWHLDWSPPAARPR